MTCFPPLFLSRSAISNVARKTTSGKSKRSWGSVADSAQMSHLTTGTLPLSVCVNVDRLVRPAVNGSAS